MNSESGRTDKSGDILLSDMPLERLADVPLWVKRLLWAWPGMADRETLFLPCPGRAIVAGRTGDWEADKALTLYVGLHCYISNMRHIEVYMGWSRPLNAVALRSVTYRGEVVEREWSAL